MQAVENHPGPKDIPLLKHGLNVKGRRNVSLPAGHHFTDNLSLFLSSPCSQTCSSTVAFIRFSVLNTDVQRSGWAQNRDLAGVKGLSRALKRTTSHLMYLNSSCTKSLGVGRLLGQPTTSVSQIYLCPICPSSSREAHSLRQCANNTSAISGLPSEVVF